MADKSTPLPERMKYLFTVQYKDGSVYQQNSGDQSIKDPARSCFYDVMLDKVAQFTLSDGINEYAVVLSDGHFEINSAPVYVGSTPESVGPMPKQREAEHGAWGDLQLVYFRRNRQYLKLGSNVEEHSHDVEYHMGWQGMGPDGTLYKQTVIVI